MNKAEYLKLNYAIELIRDTEEGGYFASYPDLPGCAAQGEDADEAIRNLEDARRLWIESRLEDNLPVPLPLSEEPSGKVLLRMTRSLHAELSKHAARQEVSLNLLINTILAEYVGGANYRTEMPKCHQMIELMKSTANIVRIIGEQRRPKQTDFVPLIDDPNSPYQQLVTTVGLKEMPWPYKRVDASKPKTLWIENEEHIGA